MGWSKDMHKARKERLRKLIKAEGHELTNAEIRERMPWARSKLIGEIRAQENVPPSTNAYLSYREMRDVPTDTVNHVPVAMRPDFRTSVAVKRKADAAARRRAKSYEEN
jgi:hypothetical protein